MRSVRPTAALHEAGRLAPDLSQAWFTASELEALGLPGLPGDKRSINRRAQTERWAVRKGADGQLMVRPRAGRGGGMEYHARLLPADAQIELARRGYVCCQPEQPKSDSAQLWAWFDRQKASVKAEAQRRLAIITEIHTQCAAGTKISAAVPIAAAQHGIGASTIFTWLKQVRGVERRDWLPTLAVDRKGGGKKAEIDPELWEIIKSDWLRPEEPPFAACFERLKRIAKERGLPLPASRTLLRRLQRDVPRSVQIMARKGAEALQRHVPDVQREVESLHAMQVVNVDGHMADVFVEHPADPSKKVRPIITVIQDIYSRKILAWRIDLSENVLATRLAFADLFREFGIPKVCLLDNSRAFASKAMTEGAKTRYRGKINPEAPAGLLVSVGIEVRFAQIYHGQSKPVERAFREMGDHVWRGPECAGAYTGPNPMKKPANYNSRKVPWDEFEQIVAQGFAAYNAREGRRAGACKGRSCDETFAESYRTADIGIANETHLTMALLASTRKRLNSRTGEITLYGNRYYSPVCLDHLGAEVTVRFDPDNLHREVHIYDKAGQYLAQAELLEDRGFFDQAGAIEVGKRRKQARRDVRAGLEAERTLDALEVAAAQVPVEAPPRPDTTIIRPIRHRATAGAAALKPQPVPAPAAGEQEILAALGKVNLRVVE